MNVCWTITISFFFKQSGIFEFLPFAFLQCFYFRTKCDCKKNVASWRLFSFSSCLFLRLRKRKGLWKISEMLESCIGIFWKSGEGGEWMFCNKKSTEFILKMRFLDTTQETKLLERKINVKFSFFLKTKK